MDRDFVLRQRDIILWKQETIFVFKGILFNNENRILIDNIKEEILDEANVKWEVLRGKFELGETQFITKE